MKTPLIAALAATLTLSACGSFSTRINPFNWGKHRAPKGDVLTPAGGYPAARTAGPLVPRVQSLRVNRTPDGVILRATGLPPTQGYWDGKLVPTNDGKPDAQGVMTYRFVLVPPPEATRVSTPQSREVNVAAHIDNYTLRAIRRIVVEGAQNSLSARH